MGEAEHLTGLVCPLRSYHSPKMVSLSHLRALRMSLHFCDIRGPRLLSSGFWFAGPWRFVLTQDRPELGPPGCVLPFPPGNAERSGTATSWARMFSSAPGHAVSRVEVAWPVLEFREADGTRVGSLPLAPWLCPSGSLSFTSPEFPSMRYLCL